MGLFSKKSNAQKAVLKTFNGRQINYVTRRIEENGSVRDDIIGKNGRIAVKDGMIHVICGTTDLFLCPVKDAECNLLLSGNGATVKGFNSVINAPDSIIVYYNKLG